MHLYCPICIITALYGVWGYKHCTLGIGLCVELVQKQRVLVVDERLGKDRRSIQAVTLTDGMLR